MMFTYLINLFWNYIVHFFAAYNKPSVKFVQTPLEKYMAKQECIFLKGCELNLAQNNENIQPVFYNHDEYEMIISTPGNILESSWKQRGLMEYTPLGNIYMYYNAYHKAFSYYADIQIPYKLLNAVAMKYVRTFYCFDFFTDTQVLPDNRMSPFTIMNQEQERLDKLKKEKKKTDMGINFQDAPFLRPKKKNVEDHHEKKKALVYKNVFKYCGSYRNIFMLKTNEVLRRKVAPSIPLTYSEFKLRQMT